MKLKLKKRLNIDKNQIVRFLKQTFTMFGITFFSFLSIHSISSIFAPSDLYSFSLALERNPYSLIEHRIVFGLTGSLAYKNANNEYPKVISKGVVSYNVGINCENDCFSVESTDITPIETCLLRYYWTNKVADNELSQWITFHKTQDDLNIEDNNNIIVSKAVFDTLESSDTKIYSPYLDSLLDVKVVGYYNFEYVEHKRIINLFREIYNEPVFMNQSTFFSLYGGAEDYSKNVQNDYIINASSFELSAIAGVFNSSDWQNHFVKYSQFSSIYKTMEQSRIKNVWYYVALFISGLSSLIALLIFINSFAKDDETYLTSSLIKCCNPYIFISLWAIDVFIVYGIGKLLKTSSLFFPPSFGITMSIILILTLLYVFIYYFFKKRSNVKEEDNDAQS